mmetsp:Transcript_3355/g.5344  ORF Transcript_3355/g.5344 Transcript_3355/m.5344 type:complete len:88 (-) Transcript_3355:79-342(-)
MCIHPQLTSAEEETLMLSSVYHLSGIVLYELENAHINVDFIVYLYMFIDVGFCCYKDQCVLPGGSLVEKKQEELINKMKNQYNIIFG